jgi:undecaprenyl diphosphate synthase
VSNPSGVPADKLPRHIAVIMDGNGRWARERSLPRIEGHRRGSQSVRACTAACVEAGIPYLTLYAFSKENWQRPANEVSALMNLLDRFLAEQISEIMEKNIRLRAIGHLDDLPDNARRRLDSAMDRSAGNTALTLTLALSYGARTEIVDAARQIAREAKSGMLDPETITEETIASFNEWHPWLGTALAAWAHGQPCAAVPAGWAVATAAQAAPARSFRGAHRRRRY